MTTSYANSEVVILGASGLLGRAVYKDLQHHFQVVGTAFSRAAPGLEQLDASKEEALVAFLQRHGNAVAVINCVAQRRPDVVDTRQEEARLLNVGVVKCLTQHDGSYFLLQISTDYVFDGTSPPYRTDCPMNPQNNYGRQKAEAEAVVRDSGAAGRAVILRVPVLYGPTPDVAESAVTILAKDVVSGKTKTIDDWSRRFPTHVADVAVVIRQILARRLSGEDPHLHGTYHWSMTERQPSGLPYTKFALCKLMGDILEVKIDHLTPDADPPSGAIRPENCELDVSALRALGIGQETALRPGLESVLHEALATK